MSLHPDQARQTIANERVSLIKRVSVQDPDSYANQIDNFGGVWSVADERLQRVSVAASTEIFTFSINQSP